MEVVEKVKNDISSTYETRDILAESCDVSKEQDVDGLFAKLKGLNIEIDVLVNNAGVNLCRSLLKESQVEDWWKTFVSNSSTAT